MPWLEWHHRNEDLKATAKTPYRLLQPVQSLSYGDADTPNMLIQGDNLEALKALLPYYAGQVKCVFIDPPYNTKSAFEHYDDNLEHAKWLSMMYPRMALLRELLSEDGSIWITLDDNEAHYFKVMCDEIFGRKNFISTFAWEKDQDRRGDTDMQAVMYERESRVRARSASGCRQKQRRWIPGFSAIAPPRNDEQEHWMPVCAGMTSRGRSAGRVSHLDAAMRTEPSSAASRKNKSSALRPSPGGRREKLRRLPG